MKRLTALAIALGLALSASTGLVGCSDESSKTTEVKQTGPGGTTTEKVTTETKQSGDNPPPATGTSGQPSPKTTP